MKNVRNKKNGIDSELRLRDLREREHFSLEIHAIQQLAVFGTRRRTALHGEGFVWVPDLGSFFKLLEVGVSPYLSFIHILSVFTNV